MATIPKVVIMDFEKDQTANFKEVKHYNLKTGSTLFSEKLNIAINRGFSKANYDYSLKIRQGKKWSKQITGLYPTRYKGIFYGDTQDKSNLVLIQFDNESTKLRLHYFENYYTRHITDFLLRYFN
jgi:hypothetical protein